MTARENDRWRGNDPGERGWREVTLSGTVRSRYEKRRSEDVSESVAGGRDVHDNLRVSVSRDG